MLYGQIQSQMNLLPSQKAAKFWDIANWKRDSICDGKVITRKLKESHFYLRSANGTNEKREWLIFTETTKCIYCFIWKLFSRKTNNVLVTGYIIMTGNILLIFSKDTMRVQRS